MNVDVFIKAGRVRKVILGSAVIAKIFVEAAAGREHVRRKVAEVPFADRKGLVAEALQVFWQHCELRRHGVRRLIVAIRVVDARMNNMAAREQRRACRRANGLNIIVVENHAAECQRVNVRRGNLRGAVEGDIVPAEVVGDDEQNVRSRHELGGRAFGDSAR